MTDKEITIEKYKELRDKDGAFWGLLKAFRKTHAN